MLAEAAPLAAESARGAWIQTLRAPPLRPEEEAPHPLPRCRARRRRSPRHGLHQKGRERERERGERVAPPLPSLRLHRLPAACFDGGEGEGRWGRPNAGGGGTPLESPRRATALCSITDEWVGAEVVGVRLALHAFFTSFGPLGSQMPKLLKPHFCCFGYMGPVRFAEKTRQNTVPANLLGEKNTVPAEKRS